MLSIDRIIPHRLVMNGLAIFGGEVATRLTTLAMALIVARRHGAEALGQYGYAVALTSILLLVPDFGLHLQAVRELATTPSRLGRVLGMMAALKTCLAVTVIVFVVPVGLLGGHDRTRRALLLILLLRLLFQTFSQGFMTVFKAHEQMHYITVQQSTNALFTFAWAGIALLAHANLEMMILGLTVGQVAETWMGWRLLRANFIMGIPLEIRWLDLKPMVLAAAPIGATMVLQALNLRLDVLILSRYVSNRELGNFQAAASFLVVTYLGTSLGMTVLFPRLSRGLRSASEWAVRSVEGILKYAVLVAACGSSLVWLGAPQLLRVTYGNDLGGAASTLKIIAGALPLVLLNSILFYVFVALDRPRVYFSALVVGIFGGGLLGLILSARFGVIGAAWADIAREGMVSSIYLSSLAWSNCAPRAGRCFSIILATGIVLAGVAVVFHRWVDTAFPWPAIWLLIVLIGSVIGLGLPGRKDWRPMIAEDSV